MEENEKLKRDNAELREQNNALMAHVERLRGAITSMNFKKLEGFLKHGKDCTEILQDALDSTPAQSLHAFCAKCTSGERSERDLEIAERVRKACKDSLEQYMWGLGERWWDFECIRNLDLSEAIKDA